MKSKIIKEIVESIKKIPQTVYDEFITEIRNCSRIFVWGLGRSGMVGRAFVMRLRHLGREGFFIGGLCPPIDKDDLLIVISRKGTAKMLLPPVEAASRTKARTICITTTRSPLTRLCKKSFLFKMADSIQFGGSLFEQTVFIFLDEVVEIYRRKEGIPFEEMEKNHANWE